MRPRLESVGNSSYGSKRGNFLIGPAPTAWVEALSDPQLYSAFLNFRHAAHGMVCQK